MPIQRFRFPDFHWKRDRLETRKQVLFQQDSPFPEDTISTLAETRKNRRFPPHFRISGVLPYGEEPEPEIRLAP